VDIIAHKNSFLHFIEVKTKRSKNFGLPEQQVSNKKMDNLRNAARQYLYLHPEWQKIQFDILAITLLKNKPVEFFLVEDVF
jgi:putative endonuclease